MAIVQHKLANVILKPHDHALDHPEIFYKAAGAAAAFDEATQSLKMTSDTDFLTYFNACPVAKWLQYAQVNEVMLHIHISGVGTVATLAVHAGESGTSVLNEASFDGDACELDLPIPCEGNDLAGFLVRPREGGTVFLHEAYYFAQVDDASINDIHLALSTTTFKNERYILPNIDIVKQGIAAEGRRIAERFHMFVVDNGQTLDAAALSDQTVTVLLNPNTGGSGGFARGMMAATAEGSSFTHVVLMDDDVVIIPESLIRVFNLLSLAKGKYTDAFINGAMLSIEQPTRQYEDVGYVRNSGVYDRIKTELNIGELADVLTNERTSVEVEQAYGAWWFSCVPVKAIEQNGLPMPFFIRCDDVEFGQRNKPTYMTMAGICVWHASFEGRFRPNVDCYQACRNFLIMMAVDDCASQDLFLQRTWRSVRMFLRDMDYSSAEMLLDAVDDYLKGPDYLAQLNGADAMKSFGARNEKLVPVSELDSQILTCAGVTPEVLGNADVAAYPSRVLSLWRTLPYDKHLLPDAVLGQKVGYVVKNGDATLESHGLGCSTLVYLDPTREKGAIRHMDKARYAQICSRMKELRARINREGQSIKASWKAAQRHLTSREFWESYLGLS